MYEVLLIDDDGKLAELLVHAVMLPIVLWELN